MLKKVCKICKQKKETIFFSINKSKKDGLHYNCKSCDSEKAKIWFEKNKEKARERAKNYNLKNKEKIAEKAKKKYKENKNAILLQRKIYYQKNKEKIINNVSEWGKNNRDKTRGYLKGHYDRNKVDYMVRCASKRAKKTHATPSWLSAIQLAQIAEMYDVALAKSVQTGTKYHVDHIHPLQGDGFNGLHVPWNLQVISAMENLSKGNKVPECEVNLFWGNL